jgi:hypothetical protein
MSYEEFGIEGKSKIFVIKREVGGVQIKNFGR